LDYSVEDGQPADPVRVLDEAFIADGLALEAGPFGEKREVIRFSSCSYQELPLFRTEVELEGGGWIELRERMLPSLAITGPAALIRADLELGGGRRSVTDYFDLVYTAFRHNRSPSYLAALDPPLALSGLARPVGAVEVAVRESPGAPPAVEARLLDADLQPLAAPRVRSFRFRLPGEKRAGFRRGDADSSGAVEPADALFVIGYLFLGGESPSCLDAADANDDGRVDVSDCVSVLRSLFSGAGPLPAPREGCGEDPAADGLSCESYPPCDGWMGR
jgi:hypothetical protein